MNDKQKIAVGGQAVIEGVMMRGPKYIATAIRRKNGLIIIKKDEFVSLTKKKKFFGIPIIRGFISLVEMMIIGFKTLNFSAEIAIEDEEKNSKKSEKKDGKLYQFFTYFIAFGLAFLLFVFLPYRIGYWSNIGEKSLIFNLFVGGIRIIFFVLYILIISFMKDVRRLFQFHGAEHKTVFAYEENPNFVLKDTKKFSTFHPRCGTSFIMIVMVIAILIFSIFDTTLASLLGNKIPLLHRIFFHLLLLPVISGISYEILKFSGKNINHWFVKIFSSPGLALQRITTKEPDENQLEVAIYALKAAMEMQIDLPNVEFLENYGSQK
ncbi:MAG: DUF1385 domain-containing protein [Candidatus Cloacimonetes bacterium]|nr:DUF1385 domain-containing protein [Candidatus Cloacimonadota bacterium]MBL7107830.1 DUF1385 domain-containing protein [Candidatus Cloacimonadota bacterium]